MLDPRLSKYEKICAAMAFACVATMVALIVAKERLPLPTTKSCPCGAPGSFGPLPQYNNTCICTNDTESLEYSYGIIATILGLLLSCYAIYRSRQKRTAALSYYEPEEYHYRAPMGTVGL